MLWLNDTREKIKKQNPGAAVTEIAKIGGSMWKEISQSKKEVRRNRKRQRSGFYSNLRAGV